MEKTRTFVAIELPWEAKHALGRLRDTLVGNGCSPVKWVSPDGIHLTLKFLGDTRVEQIDIITDSLRAVARSKTPFNLTLGKPGTFPGPASTRVIWIGLEGDVHSLCALQHDVEEAMVPLGFPREGRQFTPHLTLGRVREQARGLERQRIRDLVMSIREQTAASFQVHTFSLMRSELTRHGAIYTCLASVPLQSS
ncbi:MAG: RNA 2',3'-cyclic phosphodiesterase [Dehalococcoidia bacterium]|nr:RNA 2',3'-cyclic phosphodiesterase [Dehalococcoidia bacterium]